MSSNIIFLETSEIPQGAESVLQQAITNEYTGGFNWDHNIVSDPTFIRDHFCRLGGKQTFILVDKQIAGVIYPRRLHSEKDCRITRLDSKTVGLYWRLSNIYIDSDFQGQGVGKAVVRKFMERHPHFLYMARMRNRASQAVAEGVGIPHHRDIHILSDGEIIDAVKNQTPAQRHESYRVYMTKP